MPKQSAKATIDEQILISTALHQFIDPETNFYEEDEYGATWSDLSLAAHISEKLYSKAKVFDRLQIILSRLLYMRRRLSKKSLTIEL